MTYETQPRRTGPPVVTAGLLTAPTVVVIDPVGAAKHDDLPATWHPMTHRRHVVWCRTPAPDSLAVADDQIRALAGRSAVIDIVSAGHLAGLAVVLAERWAPVIRSLVLVDPGDGEGPPQGSGERDLAAADVAVRILDVADIEEDRPLSLGHPTVVAAVDSALDDLDRAADQS